MSLALFFSFLSTLELYKKQFLLKKIIIITSYQQDGGRRGKITKKELIHGMDRL